MMENFKKYIRGILAGISIAIGGTVFLSLESKVAASVFFAAGLFMICTFGFDLYTGKICYVFENDRSFLFGIPFIWLGNLTGTFLAAALLGLTRFSTPLADRAKSVAEGKLSDGYLSLFILAVFCDILIYVAVEGYRSCPYELGKYLSIIFGVSVFVMCGFEHSVADMFYFSMAGAWSGKALAAVIVISLGNAVGGMLIPAVRKFILK